MFSRQVLRSVRAAAPQRAFALRAAPVRSFAAAATSEVKPPVAVFGVDGTYATALVSNSLSFQYGLYPMPSMASQSLGLVRTWQGPPNWHHEIKPLAPPGQWPMDGSASFFAFSSTS